MGQVIMMIISLDKNRSGRDFVVGDLHGSFEAFSNLLKHIDFDDRCDRVVAVGDIIDRGKDSQACLELLNSGWFYSVLGNHEDLMLKWSLSSPELRPAIEHQWCEEGGRWFFSLPGKQQSRCIQLAEKLPLAIVIESGCHLYAVLHAEIPPEIDDFHDLITGIAEGDRQMIHSCLWGRRRKQARYTSVVHGIDYILAGHSPSHFPRIRHGNSLILDFGAAGQGFDSGLGLLELATQRLYIQRQNQIDIHEAVTFL